MKPFGWIPARRWSAHLVVATLWVGCGSSDGLPDARRRSVDAAIDGGTPDASLPPNPTWTQRPRTPTRRADAAAGFDPMRGRVVLFGGTGRTTVPATTWEWDGAVWTELDVPGPSPRYGARMAFDPTEAVMVLFGGFAANVALADTWTWDGAAWTERTPATSPPPTASYGVATIGGQVTLVGGRDMSSGRSCDFWRWDGANWAQTVPTTLPPYRWNHVLVHDVARDQLVLFGGRSDGGPYDDTWVGDGIDWTQAAPTNFPPGGEGAAAAFDAVAGVVVMHATDGSTWSWNGSDWSALASVGPETSLYDPSVVWDGSAVLLFGGGTGAANTIGETWRWNGSAWARTPLAPTRRASTAVAPSPDGNGVITLGGFSSPGPLNDVWRRRADVWEPLPTGPGPRFGHAAATDVVRGHTIVFGGTEGPGYIGETWRWDGTSWSQLSPLASPEPRAGAAMAYDAVRERVVLFGGWVNFANSTATAETWLWDGSTWTEATPLTSPPARSNHGMAFDAARGEIVLFGGNAVDFSLLGDTWRWNGTTWTEATPPMAPSARASFAIGYLSGAQRVVIFGGYGGSNLDDTWLWDGQTWTPDVDGTGPSGRQSPSGASDPTTGEFVLIGGQDDGGAIGDTWRYQ